MRRQRWQGGQIPTPCHTGRVRKLLIGLVMLAALLVAADFGARAYAESRAATAVQTESRLATTPDVSIEGFPFLLHAATGEYPQVIVTASRGRQHRAPRDQGRREPLPGRTAAAGPDQSGHVRADGAVDPAAGADPAELAGGGAGTART